MVPEEVHAVDIRRLLNLKCPIWAKDGSAGGLALPCRTKTGPILYRLFWRPITISPATKYNRNGQAMIEFIIGLVAVLVLFAGMIQLVSLTRAQTETMTEARENAASDMMMDFDPMTSADYIKDWQEGGDEKQLTSDDTSDTANPFDLQNTIVEKSVADPTEWQYIDKLNANKISQLHGSAVPSSVFGLIKGQAKTSAQIDMIPAVRHFLYDADSIDIECEAWMTWTKGIY